MGEVGGRNYENESGGWGGDNFKIKKGFKGLDTLQKKRSLLIRGWVGGGCDRRLEIFRFE